MSSAMETRNRISWFKSISSLRNKMRMGRERAVGRLGFWLEEDAVEGRCLLLGFDEVEVAATAVEGPKNKRGD